MSAKQIRGEGFYPILNTVSVNTGHKCTSQALVMIKGLFHRNKISNSWTVTGYLCSRQMWILVYFWSISNIPCIRLNIYQMLLSFPSICKNINLNTKFLMYSSPVDKSNSGYENMNKSIALLRSAISRVGFCPLSDSLSSPAAILPYW